jgi:preprotein translocase subunit YajC
VPQFVFILLLLAALWLLLIRPAQRRNKAQQQLLASADVGDEIVTAGGLYGTITAVREDEVRLEIAPGIEVRIARRAIAGIVSDKSEEEAEELEAAEEPEEVEAETPEGKKADTLSG